eukprot:gene10725-14390_t
MTNRDRTLSREVIATQIPSGDKATLHAGTAVMIHQTLGGAYTVQTDFGLFRIDGKDGDALGEQVATQTVAASTLAGGAPDPEAIWAQLRHVFVHDVDGDLGLVYTMDVEQISEPAPGYRVNVAMTLTAPGCGMGPAIAEDAKTKILLVPGVSDADVRITWDPPWNQVRSPTRPAQLSEDFAASLRTSFPVARLVLVTPGGLFVPRPPARLQRNTFSERALHSHCPKRAGFSPATHARISRSVLRVVQAGLRFVEGVSHIRKNREASRRAKFRRDVHIGPV